MPSWSGSALKKRGILFVAAGNSNRRQSGPYRNPLETSDFILAKTGYQGISFITGKNPQVMLRLSEEGWQLLSDWELPDGEKAQLWRSPPR